jgi:HD-GYP domain-containing protein (c-di-GMP phosphodiesterase class II)
MSIRLKQTLLLLLIALLPIVLSAWQSQRQVEKMATAIAETTRQHELQRERHYLREKVGDIGTSLQLIGRSTADLLTRQSKLLQVALQSPSPTSPQAVVFSHSLTEPLLDAPSFLTTANDCGSDCQADIQRLAAAGDELIAIYRSAATFSLWHYAGLENGVSVAFPGHGDYPAGYDPRTRPWYRIARDRQNISWLPLTIDASTGQPVLTAAIGLRNLTGEFIGATAIDLPLKKLLTFSSDSAPWMNSAHLALLNYHPELGLRIVARQDALNAGSNWKSPEQTEQLDGLDGTQLGALRALAGGESRLFENVLLNGELFNIAATTISEENESWLALLAPHSATEAAVAQAVAVVEAARAVSMQQHLIGAVLITALAAFIALYAARRVTAPLIGMSHTAEDIAAGRLESRTGLKRADELGRLSSSIDRMADNIEQLQLAQEQAYRDMIMALHRALEKKDAYTAAHSGRVTRTSLKLGKRIGLDEATLEILRFGALTHDLGKIGIADAVLNKPARLEGREIEIMRQHPVFSKTIMKPLVRFREFAEIAGSHHEHWDGSGYPEGLSGEEIHLLARIVSIADAWDSMTGDRVYRQGMPVARALEILEEEKDGGQFDPELMREFLAMMREEYAATAA